MKKLHIALICLLLLGLYACRQTMSGETQTAATVKSTADATAVFATSDTSTPTTHESKTSENEPYSDELNNIIKAHDNHPDQTKYVQYAFYDLDSDGTQELLTGLEGFGLVDVYTIQDGVAVRQEEFFVDPVEVSPPIMFKNGVIMMGRFSYYRFENGEIKRTTVIEEDGKYYSFIVNGPYPGTPITKRI